MLPYRRQWTRHLSSSNSIVFSKERLPGVALSVMLEHMNIHWTRVTHFSQLVALVLFVGVFLLGIFLGIEYEKRAFMNAIEEQSAL